MVIEDIITQRKADALCARTDAVVGLLQDWATWQKGFRVRVGYPPRSAGFCSGGSVSDDSAEHSYEASDNARCEVVDACVTDLAPNQNAAIYHRYCASVFRMRDYGESLLAAHVVLDRAFRAKGILW